MSLFSIIIFYYYIFVHLKKPTYDFVSQDRCHRQTHGRRRLWGREFGRLCVTASRWRRFLCERYEMWPRPRSGRWCFRRWWCRPSTQCWRWAVAQGRVGYNWSPSCGRCTCWTTRRRRSPRYHLLYESVSFSNDNSFNIVIIFYWNRDFRYWTNDMSRYYGQRVTLPCDLPTPARFFCVELFL